MQKKVWFNHGMPLLSDIFDVIKAEGDANIFVICSHRQSEFAGRNSCDLFVQEPTGLDGEAYLDYCLDFARDNSVDLFVPSRLSGLLVANRGKFEDIGVALLVAGEAPILALIEDKVACYQALGEVLVPMPEYRVFSDLSSFETAYAALSASHDKVCFKPVKGVFARGFRIVAPSGGSFDRLMDSGPYKATTSIGLDEARFIFGERKQFEPFMLMQYLEGRERSVDCIASRGQLVRRIIRLKDSHTTQVIESNPFVDELVKSIVVELHLEGVFNVQFKEHNGVPYLLEINSRMSGGLHKACLAAQFSLPYWAIRLALGTTTINDVPQPKTGARLCKEKVYRIEA